jgi:hypothetical protein
MKKEQAMESARIGVVEDATLYTHYVSTIHYAL